MTGLGVSLASTMVAYGLFCNFSQINQNKQKLSNIEPLKASKESQSDKENRDLWKIQDEKETQNDFGAFMTKSAKIGIYNNKVKNFSDKINPSNSKINPFNEIKNVLNSNKKIDVSENIKISNSKVANFSQIPVKENEADELAKKQATKELQSTLKHIEIFLPVTKPANNATTDSYLKKRDSLIAEVKEFLNNKSARLNCKLRCEELLAKIKELSTEISMYYEACEYIEQLNEIYKYTGQYITQFKDNSGGIFPTKALKFRERAYFLKNDEYISEIFEKIKKIIQKPNEIPFNSEGSCINLAKARCESIKKFQTNVKNLRKSYLASRKKLDGVINRLKIVPICGAPRAAGEAEFIQPKIITIKKANS